MWLQNNVGISRSNAVRGCCAGAKICAVTEGAVAHWHTCAAHAAVMRADSLGVDLAHDGVALFQCKSLGVFVLARQGHILVQVALPGRLNDSGADGRAAAALSERLVAGNQLLQLLHAIRSCSGHGRKSPELQHKPS